MIKYTKGNLLEANTDAIVNTVNEVGVMGKGIALMFCEAFPENAKLYEAACKAGEVNVGHMFVTKNPDLMGPRWIVNFPTKKHWRNPSKLQWIRDGLNDLVDVIHERKIRSIAIPPLGCGNGRLDWSDVRKEIESALGEIDGVDVVVYGLVDEYQNVRKKVGVEKLTPARGFSRRNGTAIFDFRNSGNEFRGPKACVVLAADDWNCRTSRSIRFTIQGKLIRAVC